MSGINPEALDFIAQKLDTVGINYAFVGGSIVSFLLDQPDLSPVRPTDDLDVIVEVASTQRYSDVEAKLRSVGFQHDSSQGAPMCRWKMSGLTIDIMPIEGGLLGLNTAWFSEALASARLYSIGQLSFRIISPVAFLATKLAAFKDRGEMDHFGSHDLEDLMGVIDGRERIVKEVDESPYELRQYLIASLSQICRDDAFQEALPGYLPSDSAGQGRLSLLRRKLASITALK